MVTGRRGRIRPRDWDNQCWNWCRLIPRFNGVRRWNFFDDGTHRNHQGATTYDYYTFIHTFNYFGLSHRPQNGWGLMVLSIGNYTQETENVRKSGSARTFLKKLPVAEVSG